LGYKEINIKLGTDYSEEDLRKSIAKLLKTNNFSFQLVNKSLDARNKMNIHWQIRVGVVSSDIKEGNETEKQEIEPVYKKRNKKVVVVGSGPAGFFSAYVMQKSGFDTIILERGADVDNRAKGLKQFERTGKFNPNGNYAFGEGGAGTFSDGKLTSRSKHISKEKRFILSSYIAAGAPEEIAYLAHPHIGSDNLKKVIRNLRKDYIDNGGEILFENMLTDYVVKNGRVVEAIANDQTIEADYFIIAPGHSSYETYRMLIEKGVPFRTKNFALGSRAEHKQEIINRAQWGVPELKGVKAAEYRLTSDGDGKHPVYSFCMCPGGIVVPATPYEHTNIVNGMSYYKRNGRFANAACVAGIHPGQLSGKDVSPIDSLNWLENLEQSFNDRSQSYQAPFCFIEDFMKGKITRFKTETSYPLGVVAAPLWEMLPKTIVNAMRKGLEVFGQKLKGYEKGILLGLESKTSSPIQVMRDKYGRCEGFDNLLLVGEGSGYAGGIISSAADGVKTAMNLID